MRITTLSGPGESLNLSQLSDFEAGLVVLSEIDRAAPGITWAQYIGAGAPMAMQNRQMAGWWTDLKKGVSSVTSGVANAASSTIRFVANMGGDLVRLATDAEVFNTVARAAAAYATGGGSEALQAVLGNLSSMTPAQQDSAAQALGISREELLAIASTGAAAKGTIPTWGKIAIGGGVFLVVIGGAVWLLNRGK